MHGSSRGAGRAAGLFLLAGASLAHASGNPPEGWLLVRHPDTVEFMAKVNARSFEKNWMMRAYHAVVWKGGRMASAALLQAEVTDVQALDALERLGARPGDNLPMAAWEKRRDHDHAAPDLVIRGTGVDIFLRLPGHSQPTALSAVLEDPGGRGLEMRFGGNRRNIPEWKSGCLVCLYSCPGSKVGNARYTVRDYVRGTTRFGVRKGALPPDGTRVGVVFRIKKTPGV
jgi:hypothetical protein